MIRKILFSAALLLGSAATPSLAGENRAAVAPVMSCADLARSNISTAEAPTSIAAASEQDINGHKTCVVTGFVSPRVNFEVHLPVSGWTQRYLQTGCGGLCGRVGIESPQRDCTPETNGEFVMASTDMGHDGNGGTWAASDMQLRVDFGYRGVHVTALAAKALIKAYYGQDAKWSYFSGCSDGGREALMEAQRYPQDFNGIAAGAPAFNFLVQNSLYHGWNAKVVQSSSLKPTISEADLPVLNNAVLAACDINDGVKDGIVSDPMNCKFDPATFICKDGVSENCLSADAAKAASDLYRGAHEGDDKLVVGSLMYGSELSWAGVAVPTKKMPGGMKPKTDTPAGGAPAAPAADGKQADKKPAMDQVNMGGPGMALSPIVATEMIPNMAYDKPFDPAWKLENFAFSKSAFVDFTAMHAILDATNPDLAPFNKAGGKLILWHGMQDPHISPTNSIAYWQAVRDTIGAETIANTMRLFLIPGMYHCGDGNGMTSIDVMTPLMDWVEGGKPADSLVASKDEEAAAAAKGRTLFPFPATSKLADGGNANDPVAWTQGPAMQISDTLYKDWAGADFFKPGFQKTCAFEGLNFICK
jgi:Tannase and feruloyl esterase